MKSVATIADLTDEDVDIVLSRADALRTEMPVSPHGRPAVLSLLLLEPSLRTRVGFQVAASRLGWRVVEVSELRHSPVSKMESLADTLRTVSGYSDVIVIRPGQPVAEEELVSSSVCPLINGGDVGPLAEHPSQALIDAFAMEHIVGPLTGIRLAIVGDPRMRAVRSLLALLERRPPGSLVLVADTDHLRGVRIPALLAPRCEVRSWDDLGGVDVVYISGIPHDALPLDRRDLLIATGPRIEALPDRCVVLSPMPIIDEMDHIAKRDSRNRTFLQSDLGLYVRMALLELVTGGLRDSGPAGKG